MILSASQFEIKVAQKNEHECQDVLFGLSFFCFNGRSSWAAGTSEAWVNLMIMFENDPKSILINMHDVK